MFDDLVAATTGTRGAAAVGAWTRVENAACARRLATMVVMLQDACSVDGSANRDQWCIDNWAAVTAHVGAAQRLTSGTTSNLLLVAMALQERFPKVGAMFWEGVIGYTLVRTIVTRAGLVKDPDALRQLDGELAAAVRDWEPMSQHRTGQTVDGFIAVIDPHAVIRTQTHARGRSIEVVIEDGTGMAQVFGTLFAHEATALDARLDALADTVCPEDPRTRDQRRADAFTAPPHVDRLACLCGGPDCPAAELPAANPVVVYVVASQDTINTPPAPDPLNRPSRPTFLALHPTTPPSPTTPLPTLGLTLGPWSWTRSRSALGCTATRHPHRHSRPRCGSGPWPRRWPTPIPTSSAACHRRS